MRAYISLYAGHRKSLSLLLSFLVSGRSNHKCAKVELICCISEEIIHFLVSYSFRVPANRIDLVLALLEDGQKNQSTTL